MKTKKARKIEEFFVYTFLWSFYRYDLFSNANDCVQDLWIILPNLKGIDIPQTRRGVTGQTDMIKSIQKLMLIKNVFYRYSMGSLKLPKKWIHFVLWWGNRGKRKKTKLQLRQKQSFRASVRASSAWISRRAFCWINKKEKERKQKPIVLW